MPKSSGELFTGEQFDPDLGFYYLRARYHNPDSGRFWTMDSYEGDSEDPLTLHKYIYCHASPIALVDPSGLAVEEQEEAVGVQAYLQAVYTKASVSAVYFQLAAIDAIATITPYALAGTFVVAAIGSGADALLKNTQVVPAGNFPRGRFVEELYGANLRGNYPKIDDWQNDIKLATSVKSHGLTSGSAADYLRAFENDALKLKGIEKTGLYGFAPSGDVVRIAPGEMVAKAVVEVIPETEASLLTNPAFRAGLQRISDTTKTIFRVVPLPRFRK